MEELVTYKLYRSVSQAFAALLPCYAVGVMGDQRFVSLSPKSYVLLTIMRRVYGQMIALRAVVTTDFMTATRAHFDIENRDFLDHVSSRITNEIEGITRVLYDGKYLPPMKAGMSADKNQ